MDSIRSETCNCKMIKLFKLRPALLKNIYSSIILFALVFAPAASAEEVDLELVIAMDASGSISEQDIGCN